MALRATAIALLSCLALPVACRHAEIPQTLPAPVAGAPRHPLRLAILPLVEDETRDDGPDDASGYVYRGVEYDHTRFEDLSGTASDRLTEMLAKHLAAAHLFSQVILVRTIDQAPEAELVLSGRVRRMRGYVEHRAGSEAKKARPEGERMVLAEVFFEDLEVRDARRPERVLLRVDAGWSIDEPRLFANGAPSPWAILGEAVDRALAQLEREIDAADLTGAVVVRDRVHLQAAPPADARDGTSASARPFGSLADAAPEGWTFARTSSASRPLGWKTETPRCLEARLEQKQTLRFHRALGPYRPSVVLWACPKDQAIRFDALTEFPARYLGARADGSRFFALALGASNWPTALEDVSALLLLRAPPGRYVFELDGS